MNLCNSFWIPATGGSKISTAPQRLMAHRCSCCFQQGHNFLLHEILGIPLWLPPRECQGRQCSRNGRWHVTCSPFPTTGTPPILGVDSLGDIFALDLGMDHLLMQISILVMCKGRRGFKIWGEKGVWWEHEEIKERLKDGRKGRRKGKKGVLHIIDVAISLCVYVSSNVLEWYFETFLEFLSGF